MIRTPSLPRRVAFVGRLAPEKGPDIFLSIVEGMNVECRMYGDGPMKGWCENKARDGFVRFMGWRPSSEAFAWADIVVVPSRREGIPLVVLEAGANGIAVLAQDTGGIASVLGGSDLLRRVSLHEADLSNIESWRAQLADLLQEKIWKSAAFGLKEAVRQRFELKTQTDLLTTTLAELVE